MSSVSMTNQIHSVVKVLKANASLRNGPALSSV